MVDKGITVAQLYDFVKEQIDKGNGNKHIMISNDDEGNGFHRLFFQFTDDVTAIKNCLAWEVPQIDANEVVILG